MQFSFLKMIYLDFVVFYTAPLWCHHYLVCTFNLDKTYWLYLATSTINHSDHNNKNLDRIENTNFIKVFQFLYAQSWHTGVLYENKC